MENESTKDKLIGKIQYFADMLQQCALEQEALAIVMEDSELKSLVRSKILFYEEIVTQYNSLFKEIIHSEPE